MTRVARMDAAYLTNFALASPEQLGAARDRLELELATPADEPLPLGGAESYDRETLAEAARELFQHYRDQAPIPS